LVKRKQERMTDEKKSDVILSDGKAITFDKKKIKRVEWTQLFSIEQPIEESEEILGRFTQTDAEYIRSLSLYDWQLLLKIAREVVQKPIDPNLPSESTSQS
jgi:hypothetical protein